MFQNQVLTMLQNEVISISQAEYYSQVHLTSKPTSSHSDAISPDVTQNEGSINKTTVQSNFSAAVKTPIARDLVGQSQTYDTCYKG